MADLQYISSISTENHLIAILLVCQGVADRYLWPVWTTAKSIGFVFFRDKRAIIRVSLLQSNGQIANRHLWSIDTCRRSKQRRNRLDLHFSWKIEQLSKFSGYYRIIAMPID
ncbi:MAG: hypothetical protein DRR15_16265 [Gammaproteobacteria bacterium]|nr:MAG: hypothetical protein DRR15_16265 [Gammaproteobacteria bacterium]